MAGIAIVVLLGMLFNRQPQVTANDVPPTSLPTINIVSPTPAPTATVSVTISPQVIAITTPTVPVLVNQGKDVAPPPPPGLLEGSANNRPTATPGR